MTKHGDDAAAILLRGAARVGMSPEGLQALAATMKELDDGLADLNATGASDKEKVAFIRKWQARSVVS